MTERFNGLKIKTERLSDEELYELIRTTQERQEKVGLELVRLIELADGRGLVNVGEE